MQNGLPFDSEQAEFTNISVVETDDKDRSIVKHELMVSIVDEFTEKPSYGSMTIEYTPDTLLCNTVSLQELVDDFYGVKITWDSTVSEIIAAFVESVKPRFVRIVIDLGHSKHGKIWKARKGYCVYPEDWESKSVA